MYLVDGPLGRGLNPDSLLIYARVMVGDVRVKRHENVVAVGDANSPSTNRKKMQHSERMNPPIRACIAEGGFIYVE